MRKRDTIEDVIEPYLIQQGLLQRTPRGRIATASAYTHFGLHAPTGARGGDLWSRKTGPPREPPGLPAGRDAPGHDRAVQGGKV